MRPSVARRIESLQIQIVLFNNDVEAVRRAARATAAACRVAQQRTSLATAIVTFGDCSSTPVLGGSDWPALEAELVAAGIADARSTFFDANLGSAGGSNRLAADALTDAILVLNPDVFPGPSSIARLVEALNDSTVGIAEGRQIPLEHPKSFDLTTGDTSWASGACMMVRTSAFSAVGGFDEEFFFLHGDDVDLSWRVRLNGGRVVHVPSAAFFHSKVPDGGGRPTTSFHERYYQALSKLLLARRYDAPLVLRRYLAAFAAGDPPQQQALGVYRRMEAEGDLPSPLPDGRRVAQFVGSEYAVHRF